MIKSTSVQFLSTSYRWLSIARRHRGPPNPLTRICLQTTGTKILIRFRVPTRVLSIQTYKLCFSTKNTHDRMEWFTFFMTLSIEYAHAFPSGHFQRFGLRITKKNDLAPWTIVEHNKAMYRVQRRSIFFPIIVDGWGEYYDLYSKKKIHFTAIQVLIIH